MYQQSLIEPKDDMISLQSAFLRSKSVQDRKTLGQFFTSPVVADYMASMIHKPKGKKISILDAGAGTGVLTAATAVQLLELGCKAVHAVLYELDSLVIEHLNQTMKHIEHLYQSKNGKFTFEIRNSDFVLDRPDKKESFDVSVINPPYFKYNVKTSPYAKAVSDLYSGDPNIYASFMAIVASSLNEGGQMVAITPRSFTNGLYFKNFRDYLLNVTAIESIHIFKHRDRVFKNDADKVLQYGPTEGRKELIEQLITLHKEYDGLDIGPEHMIVTSAAQQAIALTAKIFVDDGDEVICARPTYLGFLQAVRSYRGKFVGVDIDPKDGFAIDQIEKILKDRGGKGRIKYLYTVPDFQNPSGITLSLEKRKRLIELAHEYEFIIIEDSPYRQLRYSGTPIPPMLALDTDRDVVVTLYTFSKIFAPGLRLGWVVGPTYVIEKLILVKQPADLCTSPFAQLLAAHYIEGGFLAKQIPMIIEYYRPKQQAMIDAFERELGDVHGVNFTKPEGGMFLWLQLPEYINSKELFQKTLEKNVAFVVGAAFDCYGERNNTARINFSFPSVEQIHQGVKVIGDCVKEMIKEKSAHF